MARNQVLADIRNKIHCLNRKKKRHQARLAEFDQERVYAPPGAGAHDMFNFLSQEISDLELEISRLEEQRKAIRG
jgi:chaperonin cofactor prefoldin